MPVFIEIRKRHFLYKREIGKGIFDFVGYSDTECFALRGIEGGDHSLQESSLLRLLLPSIRIKSNLN